VIRPTRSTGDDLLRDLLASRTEVNRDYWSFSYVDRHRGAPEPYQYPAMMVSRMQGELLEFIRDSRTGRPTVFDPFLGSGTTLAEALRLGCQFVGTDINPLAVLLSRVKAEAHARADVEAATQRVVRRIKRDRKGLVEAGPWVAKWFRPDVAESLSALRRAIRQEANPVVRRALWVAVAEVVRTSGNMRIGRPKLQTRHLSELGRAIDVPARFERIAGTVAAERRRHEEDARRVADKTGEHASFEPIVAWGDARDLHWPKGVPPADVVLTSPPYGDNHTTMPYGQQSYLPLRWIDVADIDARCEGSWLLESSKTLDTHSLGGSKRICGDRVSACAARSPTLSGVLADLVENRDGWTRVAAFFADLDDAWERILENCVADAHFAVTLGNRTVCGRHVATVRIVRELLESRGVRHLASLERTIRRGKRLAPRNSYAARTIGEETVLVMRRCDT
jgi:hypothetical protein